jgi:hypothetical protein
MSTLKIRTLGVSQARTLSGLARVASFIRAVFDVFADAHDLARDANMRCQCTAE